MGELMDVLFLVLFFINCVKIYLCGKKLKLVMFFIDVFVCNEVWLFVVMFVY